ncbi:SPOR domain-containing protein [Desulfovulcanus sp.]
MAKKKADKRKKKVENKFKLNLTLSGLIYLGIFIILGMVWAFILGVYIGRGYKPEDVVPEIARIMPETKSWSNQSPPASAKQEILRPEQLEFYEKLKDQPNPKLKKDTPTRAETKGKSRARSKNTKTNSSSAKQNIFSYTYQVAAFKTLNQANKMQKKLVTQGVMSSITKAFAGDRPWFRVFVHFQGTPKQVEKFKNKLKRIGIKQPILKRKKPL